MRNRPLLAAALVALLVTSGCTALGGGDGSAPSAEEFPNAGEIDESRMDRHAPCWRTRVSPSSSSRTSTSTIPTAPSRGKKT